MVDKASDEQAAAALKKMLNKPDGANKLFQMLKALSAMKLTKEDSTPNLIISMDDQFKLSLDESGRPFLYQGSVGAAFNLTELKACGITHILTCASGIGKRFPDEFKYHQLPLLDTPT